MFIARGSQGQQATMEGIALAIAIPLIPLFAYGPRHLTWIAEIYLIGVFRFYHQTLMTLTVREMAWAVRAKPISFLKACGSDFAQSEPYPLMTKVTVTGFTAHNADEVLQKSYLWVDFFFLIVVYAGTSMPRNSLGFVYAICLYRSSPRRLLSNRDTSFSEMLSRSTI